MLPSSIISRLPAWTFLVIAAAALCGCFENSTVVRVNRDGSGTIERLFLVNREALGRVKFTAEEILSLSDDPLAPASPEEVTVAFDFFDREALAGKAGRMGEGVVFASGERVSTPSGEGYRAVYRFADIDRVRLPLAGGANAGASLLFSMSRGATATLIVLQDPPFATIGPILPGEQDSSHAHEPNLPAGVKFRVGVEVGGEVLSSDARFRDGNLITLVDIDTDRMLAATLPVDGTLPGVRAELSPRVKIVFR